MSHKSLTVTISDVNWKKIPLLSERSGMNKSQLVDQMLYYAIDALERGEYQPSPTCLVINNKSSSPSSTPNSFSVLDTSNLSDDEKSNYYRSLIESLHMSNDDRKLFIKEFLLQKNGLGPMEVEYLNNDNTSLKNLEESALLEMQSL